ncbi:MAG: YggT family protein [Pseudomonadota bacterium]
MSAGPLSEAASLVLNTAFYLYTLVVAVRFLMQATRADYYNPLAQSVVSLTNPVLKPLRRFVPGFASLDIAALVLCLLLIILKLAVFSGLGLPRVDVAGFGFNASQLGPMHWLLLAPFELANMMLNIFLVGIIILAVMSWVGGMDNPIASVLHDITRPVTDPVRRWVKPMGGLDLSPIVALLLIQLVKILVLQPLLRALL